MLLPENSAIRLDLPLNVKYFSLDEIVLSATRAFYFRGLQMPRLGASKNKLMLLEDAVNGFP